MLCLVTIVTDKLLPIRNEILHHRQRMCDSCGMRCVSWDGNATRSAPWMKIEAMRSVQDECDRILWMDADATPVHFVYPVAHPASDLIFARDENGLNSGIVLVQTSSWTRRALAAVWDRVEFLHHPWWEQEAIRRCIHEDKVGTWWEKVRLSRDFERHIRHISGCMSTRPASKCRRRILRDVRKAGKGACRRVNVTTHPVDSLSVMPKHAKHLFH